MKDDAKCQVAVIGMGCYYPGAKSPLQLWENILARRQQFRQMPDLRLPDSDYYDPDPSAIDKTYLNKAAVLDGYTFNWLDKRIPKNTFESTDIVHWLALDTALQALADARYTRDNILHDTTGVIIGNTLTGEFTRSNTMLLRWPYVRKALHASMKKKGLSNHIDGLEYTMEKYYKSVFAPVTEDTLAGGLANTIAGRVCNYLDLHGGGYIVDGACSSSLLAICTAANYLELGQMDMVIAGGVDISLDTFELVGFAKTGALTHDEMRVYDKQGRGFIPGEGCGMVILKRLEDAIRDKDQVYAIIKGWGIASDGKGGITAPSAVGQSRALTRAYEKAGISTDKIDFIEGHGTGTTVGDKAELEGITLALNKEKTLPLRNCGVTSFKSIVGHTKAAAGVGAFIKTVISLNRRVLPPTAGLKDFNPIFEEFAKTVYPIINGQVRDAESTLIAGVSAMGFGGINSHVLLQSGDAPSPKLKPVLEERKLMVSNQSSEVFLFAAKNKDELVTMVEKALTDSHGISYAELADFAAFVNLQVENGKPYRAAVVAYTPSDLERKLKILRAGLDQPETKEILSFELDSVVLGQKKDNLRIGALFPGQGAQRLNMTYKLVERYDWARDIVGKAKEFLSTEDGKDIFDAIYKFTDRAKDKNEENKWREKLKQTDVAQPAIILASLLWHKFLERLGITISSATGHSLGELMSFYAAGFYNEETLLKFAAFRGKSMAGCGSGTMASLVCSRETAEGYIQRAPGYVTIANINAPEQTVISGEAESVRWIIKLAEQEHIGAVELPVSAAFHSKLISGTSEAIKSYGLLKAVGTKKPKFKVISSVFGKEMDETVDMNVYFSEQAINQVNFIDAVNVLKTECDVLVEIGPGKVLSGLAAGITHDIKAFAVEARPNDDFSLNVMLANVFVRGASLDIKELYAGRLVRDFIPAYQRTFIVNPLERPFPDNLIDSSGIQENGGDLGLLFQQLNLTDIDLDAYIAQRGDFIRDVVMSDLRHFKPHEVSRYGHKPKAVGDPAVKSLPEVNVSAAKCLSDVKSLLVEKIAVTTGFPSSGFTDSMRLLDDLNLDSIKAGALLTDLAKSFGLLGKITTADLANASIGDIVGRFDKIIAESGGLVAENQPASENDITQTVFGLVAEKTGFPKDQLDLGHKLLNDLNLDSIKAGSLLAELLKKYNLAGKMEAAVYANASLGEIISKITEFKVNDAHPILPVPSTGNSVRESVLALIAEKTGFPVEALKPGFRLLDDLNLDSIKAGGLLATLARQYNLQGKFEPAAFSNAPLSEIINAINSLKPSQPVGKDLKPQMADENYWVRSFSVNLINEPLNPGPGVQINGNGTLLIVYSESSKNAVSAITGQMKQQSVRFEAVDYQSLFSEKIDSHARMIVFVPEDTGERKGLEETVGLFSTVARQTFGNVSEIGFVQYGDGSFSRLTASGKPHRPVFSAVAFASSLHLERPDVKIRVTEVDRSHSPETVFGFVHNEFATGDRFVSAGYDHAGQRCRMVYSLAGKKSVRRDNVKPGKDDVVLVTGGAKGITAECALSLAKEYRCKMALVGSSSLTSEIQGTLNRFADQKIVATYYSCDITDASAVNGLIKQVNADLGKITMVIHGAGMNIPRRADQVSSEEAYREIAPKLIGAWNLMDSLKGQKLKLFTAFTSIIGVTGMQGNSWYAFSNETVDRLLRNFHEEYGVDTLTLAFSIWGQVGMGERMGSTKVLADMGIGAITPEKGVGEFLHWMTHKTDDQQVVVAARLGGLDTWNRYGRAYPLPGRYLQEPQYFEPEVELVAYSRLSRKNDKYTGDHNYNGSLLFPTVFGLEAMAQAASYVSGISDFNALRIENISLLKPIVVPDTGETKIMVRAVVQTGTTDENEIVRVRVGISTEQDNFTEDHFSAEFVFNAVHETPTGNFDIRFEPLPVEPRTDLYSWLLFQGKTFQNIDKVYDLGDKSAIFSVKPFTGDTSEICLSDEVLAPFILGSPLFRDLLLQSAQLILTKQVYLPVRIREWDFYDLKAQDGGGFVVCKLVENNSSSGVFDVTYVNNCQAVLEQIRGYEVRAMKPTPEYPLPGEIADPLAWVRKKINDGFRLFDKHIAKAPKWILFKHHELFNELNAEERHAIEQEVFAREMVVPHSPGLSNNENKLIWAHTGKPEISGSELGISISHSRSFLLMTVGAGLQGCDLEFVEQRTPDECIGLLGDKHKSLLLELKEIDKDSDVSTTRIWSVLEAVGKAFGTLPDEVNIESVTNPGILFSARVGSQLVSVVSFPVPVWPGTQLMMASLAGSIVKEATMPQVDEHRHYGHIFDPVSGKFIHHFSTSFKDCKGFYGKTYFTDFPVWMGHLRELALSPISKQLVADLSSGNFGMVTNASSVMIYNEADALDKITGKVWVTGKSDFSRSFIDLNFEWFKLPENGQWIKLAESGLSTTWVTIEGHGVVKQSPIPAYFLDFLADHSSVAHEGTDNPQKPFITLQQLGNVTYESTVKPRPEILLLHKTFQTGMYDGNSVGNLYYSNYYDWQAKTFESFMYKVVPEVFRDNGKSGEFICLESIVNHLQEAMPFEEIGVDMFLESLYENGMRLFFEYYSLGTSGKRKLAFGHNTMIWAKRSNEKSLPLPHPLPDKIMLFFRDFNRKLSTLSA